MSVEHKAALAAGRDDGRIVKRYLEAVAESKPSGRGRRRSVTAIRNRLKAVEKELESASALGRLHLVQERRDLQAELARSGEGTSDLATLRKSFIVVAKRYSERKGISYEAWREVGVDAATLAAADISRSTSG